MNLKTQALAAPRLVALCIRVERAPAATWLVFVALALLPTWLWMARRMLDRSDDPLGLLAIAAFALLAWHCRKELRTAPRLVWLAAALTGAVGSVLAIGVLPPLLASLLALAAFGAALAAFLPQRVPSAPVLGLSLLSLPWIASLQFYAGFPLRVLTAEASRWLLAPFFLVERSGTALQVDGRLVIVDAPCSGVQLLWLGYFSACAAALHSGRDSRRFLARLPLVSVFVLAGNILRNAVLVGLEGAGYGSSGAVHEAVGLVVLAAVCCAIACVMSRRVCNERCAPSPVRKQACTPYAAEREGERHV